MTLRHLSFSERTTSPPSSTSTTTVNHQSLFNKFTRLFSRLSSRLPKAMIAPVIYKYFTRCTSHCHWSNLDPNVQCE